MAASDGPRRASARAMALVEAYYRAVGRHAVVLDGAGVDEAAGALLAYLAALEAARDFYADPARYEYRRVGAGPWLEKPAVLTDGGAVARATRKAP